MKKIAFAHLFSPWHSEQVPSAHGLSKTFTLPLLLGAFILGSCDDDTSFIGTDIMPDEDNVTAQSKVFNLNSTTVKVDSVLANTSTCYLGSIVDPEMRVKTTSDFLAQFHVPQNFKLPEADKMVKDENGEFVADSCDIRLYFDEYYGDSLATMKLSVYELDKNRILDDSTAYYTNIVPGDYVDESSAYKKTISYAIKDLTRPDNETSGINYYRQVAVKLSKEYGTKLLKAYYENPSHFINSYQFIRNVCPGFYFKSDGGVGSMLSTKLIGLNLYFSYHTTNAAGNDTIVDGMQRMGATEEVIQTTHIDNQYPGSIDIEGLDQKDCTYLKTPTGLFTEMTLPISEIVAGEHYTDSINQAKITIRKYNSTTTSSHALPTPDYLLMVRKSEMNKFFESRRLPDNADSYLSTQFSTSANAYQFSNISQLIIHMKIERDTKAGVFQGDDEATRNAKYAVWEASNPDWNKVMIIPVAVKYSTTTNYYGQSVKTLQSVTHQLGLSSARLKGGKDNPLQIEVMYSRYNRR